MPKVLRIINRFNLGGPTFNASYLSRYLSPDFETLLIGGEKDPSEASSLHIPIGLGIEPVVIKEMRRSLNPLNDVRAFFRIRKIIRSFKPDIVHTHAAKAGTIGRLAAFTCGVPVIIHTFHGHVFHSYFGKLKTGIYKVIERCLAKISTRIIAISEEQARELVNEHSICKRSKLEIIPLGFDLSRFREGRDDKRIAFREKYKVAQDEVLIVIIGRLVPIKNHQLFLDALKLVAGQTTKKIKAFIVGDGEERENIEAHAKALALNYSTKPFAGENTLLTFTSWIYDVDQVCAGADIVALTSKNEGTPVSLIEAQAAGCSVVSTNVGGIENVVQNGKTALLCEQNDAITFAKHLLCLVEDEKLRKQMGACGWEYVSAKYHYSRLVDDMKALYMQLLTAN